jgi:hypothetical protein
VYGSLPVPSFGKKFVIQRLGKRYVLSYVSSVQTIVKILWANFCSEMISEIAFGWDSDLISRRNFVPQVPSLKKTVRKHAIFAMTLKPETFHFRPQRRHLCHKVIFVMMIILKPFALMRSTRIRIVYGLPLDLTSSRHIAMCPTPQKLMIYVRRLVENVWIIVGIQTLSWKFFSKPGIANGCQFVQTYKRYFVFLKILPIPCVQKLVIPVMELDH